MKLIEVSFGKFVFASVVVTICYSVLMTWFVLGTRESQKIIAVVSGDTIKSPVGKDIMQEVKHVRVSKPAREANIIPVLAVRAEEQAGLRFGACVLGLGSDRDQSRDLEQRAASRSPTK
jgi:hypothetical protein